MSMADEAELAFLEAQKDEEYDPTRGGYNMPDAPTGQEEYDPTANFSARSEHSESTPPESGANSPQQAAEGEHGSQAQPPQTSAEASAAPQSKRPRTVGGFVDESEDEEEEPAAQPQEANASATGAAESPQPSFTNTPKNTLPNPDVQLHSAQDQAPASVSAPVAVNEPAPSVPSLPNGSTPVPDVTKPATPDVMNVVSARPSVAPATPAPTSASLPKARLPQDRVWYSRRSHC
jgi:cleavage stimulation factor subunit 3